MQWAGRRPKSTDVKAVPTAALATRSEGSKQAKPNATERADAQSIAMTTGSGRRAKAHPLWRARSSPTHAEVPKIRVQGSAHRLLSSSFLGLPYRILNMKHKKKLLRSLWVGSRGSCKVSGLAWRSQFRI